MPTESYHVVFKGEIASGHNAADVKARLTKLFKVPESTVERMFQGQSVRLKKNVDHTTALQYQSVVEQTGARCYVLPAADTPKASPDLHKPTAARPRVANDPSVNPAGHAVGNVYAPPGASLTDDFTATDITLGEPQAVPAGRAMRWLSSGFELFKESPGIWIGLMVVWFVILILLSVFPVVNLLVNILTPIFIGGIMIGCRDVEEGEGLQIGHLFAAFQGTGGRLAALGALQLLSFLAVGIVIALLLFSLGASSGIFLADMGEPGAGAMLMVVALPLLLGLGLTVPIAMAFWFAPLLVAVHDVGVLDSIRLSFIGCLRNWLGFLLYGLLLMLLMIIAMIPLGLGLLVMAPVAIASVYTSHRDIFLDNLD